MLGRQRRIARPIRVDCAAGRRGRLGRVGRGIPCGDGLSARADAELLVQNLTQHGELQECAVRVAATDHPVHDRDVGALVARVERDELVEAPEHPKQFAMHESKPLSGS